MPTLDDYNSLYYDLKCISVLRKSKLTNVQFKELVSKAEVRPYNKDEIITELYKETKAALYLVITGSVWLGRDGMAPIKLPSGCNFGEELLKASEGNPSGMVLSPYSVKAADDSCVCAVLTMDACREVFDIDNAEKQTDANFNMLLASPISVASSTASSKTAIQNTKAGKSQKKRDDDDLVSSKSTKSTKVKKEKKKVKNKAREETHDKIETRNEVAENKIDEDKQMTLQSVPNLSDSKDGLDFETANEEPSSEIKPDSGDSSNVMGRAVTLDSPDQSEFSLNDNDKSANSMENSVTSFSDLKNKFSGNISSPVQVQGSSSFVNSINDTKKQPASPVSDTRPTRRWWKDEATAPQPAASSRLPASDVPQEKTETEGEVLEKATNMNTKPQRSAIIEPGKFRGPVSARRGTVAERFLNKVAGNVAREEAAKPPVAVTQEDVTRDAEASMLDGTQVPLGSLISESESGTEGLQVEQPGTANPYEIPGKQQEPPPPEELISPVRVARKAYENQIKQNSTVVRRPSLKSSFIPMHEGSNHSKDSASASSDPPSPTKERRRFSLPVQCNPGLFAELDQDGSESFSNDDGHIREVVVAENPPEAILEVDEEADEDEGDPSMQQNVPKGDLGLQPTECSSKDILSPPPPPLDDFESPKLSPKNLQVSKKEKKRITETKVVEPDLSPIQPKKAKDQLTSPRKRKDKASFIARIAKFEDQTGKSGVPVVRQAGNVYQVPTNLPTNFKAPRFPKTDQEEKMLKGAIKKRFVFENLPDKTIKSLTAAFEKIHVPAGTQLFSQGDEDKYFYVVANGQCDILIDGERHDVAKSGDSFGEEALLHNSRRRASATVRKDSVLYRFDQTTFRHLLQDEATRSAVHKRALLEKLDFLENASTEQLQKLSNLLTLVKFKKGETLAKQDNIGEKFFLIAEGRVECQDVKLGRIAKDNKIMGPGDYFGKHAVLAEEPIMKANVVALTNGKAYVVSKELRDEAMGSSLIPVHSRTLHSVKAFERKFGRPLKHADIVGLTRLIKNIEYSKGDTIVEADQDVDAAIYFVRSGKVHETEGRKLLLISEGAHFGESVFQSARDNKALKGQSTSKIVAESDCTCGVLSVKDYYAFFGDEIAVPEVPTSPPSPQPTHKSTMPYSEAIGDSSGNAVTRPPKDEKKVKKAKTAPGTQTKDAALQSPQNARLRTKIALESLEKKVCLGEGEFGQVWLVVDKKAEKQQPYVLKIQSKYHLITEGEVDVCKREKDVLLNVDHPFIINLFDTYQDPAFVYMLLDFVPGGELFSILNNDEGRVKIHEDRARFYLLGIADALSHLHEKKYVYRDLKPENVMIDRHGYPKLIDFGFAKKVVDQTFTLCGTPAYLAPEIVKSQGHSWPADHWALGVLSFEMVMGFSPFYEDGIEQFELYRMIVEEDFPELKGRSSAATDFISRLLEKSPSNRLGSLARGEKDILSHRWFGDLSTTRMRERAIKAPWIPAIKSQFDTSNFDDWSGVMDKTLDKGPPLSVKHAALFDGF